MLLELQKQITELIVENAKGATALFETEINLANAENELDKVEQTAFLAAEGTVADRQAVARLKAGDVRLQRDIRKAEHNRVKVKISQISTALMALGTQVKLMQAEMKL